MFAVIFEVKPKVERYEAYLAIAARLRPALLSSEGFVENTRFASRSRDGLLVSVSLWRDEKALIRWRTHGGHHAAQCQGRADILSDYRLRVGEVFAHSTSDIGDGHSRLDTTEVGEAKAVLLADGAGADGEALTLAAMTNAVASDCDCFDAITEEGRVLALQGFKSEGAAAHAFQAKAGTTTSRHLAIRIIRDYGMNERREAVQWMA